DDGVVTLGGASVGGIGDRARHWRREYLPDKAIQSLVGDHHGGDSTPAAPAAERSQSEAIRHLECIRRELFEQRRDRSRQHRAITTCERDQPGWQGDTDNPRWKFAPL